MDLYSTQMEWIRALHGWRTPALDEFIKAIDFFDRPNFFLILFAVSMVGYFWKSGLKLYYVLFLSSLLNYFFKELFQQPRPFHLDTELAVITVKGYGFPSGAAQTAMLLSSILIYSYRTLWAWALGIAFFALLSFSRIYFGVHFFTDLLGGWLIGFCLFLFYVYGMPAAERALHRRSYGALVGLSVLIPSLFLSINPTYSTVIKLVAAAMAGSIGIVILLYYDKAPPRAARFWEFVLRSAVGIIGIFLLHAGLAVLPREPKLVFAAVDGVVTGLWFGLMAHLIVQWMGLTVNPSGKQAGGKTR